jgi:hypothetical protein
MIVLQIAIQCLVCVITDSRCASAVLGLGDPGGLVACLFFYNFSLVVGLFFFSMGTGLRCFARVCFVLFVDRSF